MINRIDKHTQIVDFHIEKGAKNLQEFRKSYKTHRLVSITIYIDKKCYVSCSLVAVSKNCRLQGIEKQILFIISCDK